MLAPFLFILAGALGFLVASDGAGSLTGAGVDRPEPTCLLPYEHVPAQGLSCRIAGGLWKVMLADGGFAITHGPDPPHRVQADENPTARPIVCADANPHGNYNQVAILAWPSDRIPNKTVRSLRRDIKEMNGRLYQDAVLSGSPDGADYVFDCDGAGQIRVDEIQLSVTAAEASWGTIVSDLRARGYDKTNEKYVIHWDEAVPPYCGMADFWGDESDGAGNPNNGGPSYGINFDCEPGWLILMHENGHNLGAVQYNAPFSTGWAHCWQEWDVMCYTDGGPRDPGRLRWNCRDYDHWDCRNNDYFDAKIGAGTGKGGGSYLDTHWNLGECYVRWLVNNACFAAGTTVFAASVSISKGSSAGGGAPQLGTDDDEYFNVGSTAGSPKTLWDASFRGVPTSLTRAMLTHKGKNSRSCTQTLSMQNWFTSKWVVLDRRMVGGTEVELANLVPPGPAANYVSGAGEVKLRIACKTQGATFIASGDLAKLVYAS